MAVLGRTPLREVRIPLGKVRFRIEKEGYIALEDTISGVGASIDCLLVEKGVHPTDTSRATVDEINALPISHDRERVGSWLRGFGAALAPIDFEPGALTIVVDAASALALIFPTQRPLFEAIYRSPDYDIQTDAQAMERFTLQRADENSAVVLIHRIHPDGKERSHPITTVRAPDGSWLVYDY